MGDTPTAQHNAAGGRANPAALGVPLPVAPNETNRLPWLGFEESGPTSATRLEAHLDALLRHVSLEDKSVYRVRNSYQRLLDDLRRDLLDDDA